MAPFMQPFLWLVEGFDAVLTHPLTLLIGLIGLLYALLRTRPPGRNVGAKRPDKSPTRFLRSAIKPALSLPDLQSATRQPFSRTKLKRSRSWDKLHSPLPVRVAKARFGQNIATALDERSATRFTLPNKTMSRETMPMHHTAISSDTLSAGKLPSDTEPWDRLHVWLVSGEGLPHRPWLWPFEPYVVVTTVGEDTGSTPEVPIGAYEFQVRAPYMHASRPVWDERGLVCFKRGGADGYQVVIKGSGKLWPGLYPPFVLSPSALGKWLVRWLFKWLVSVLSAPVRVFFRDGVVVEPTPPATFELPTAGGAWEEVHVPLPCSGDEGLGGDARAGHGGAAAAAAAAGGGGGDGGGDGGGGGSRRGGGGGSDVGFTLDGGQGFIVLRVRVSAWEDRPVSPSAMRAFTLEHAVLDGSEGERGVISYRKAAQASTAKKGERRSGAEVREAPRRALLWLPGRNDAFFHPHVGSLLAELGIDLYVLNYRRVGECRRFNLFDNPMRNSHCSSGDFAEYHADVRQALEFVRSQDNYGQIIGYSHSTGSPVLLDYLMAHGDSEFSGFVFNSPFLDWGWVGGRLSKLLVVHLPSLLTKLRVWNDESEILGGGGPSAWALQLFSQYNFDPDSRPLFTVPVTVGYCRGINRVHALLRRHSAAGAPITIKPFVVLTSKGDDVLNGDETMIHAHAIGPNRTLIELNYARHDVFASADNEVVHAALAYLRTWLKSQHFA